MGKRGRDKGEEGKITKRQLDTKINYFNRREIETGSRSILNFINFDRIIVS